jgi:DNA-binding PadR family transcriptional regulator
LATTRKRTDRYPKPTEIRPLDMFLLGLVRDGLITPYDWQTKARISLGASLPAVRRLLVSDLLIKAAIGPRGRHEYALTDKGRDALRNLKRYLERVLRESPPGDLETALRLASLAGGIKQDQMAEDFLLRAAAFSEERHDAAKRRLFDRPFTSRLGGLYSLASNHCEIEQQEAAAKLLRSLSRSWSKVADFAFEVVLDKP